MLNRALGFPYIRLYDILCFPSKSDLAKIHGDYQWLSTDPFRPLTPRIIAVTIVFTDVDLRSL